MATNEQSDQTDENKSFLGFTSESSEYPRMNERMNKLEHNCHKIVMAMRMMSLGFNEVLKAMNEMKE